MTLVGSEQAYGDSLPLDNQGEPPSYWQATTLEVNTIRTTQKRREILRAARKINQSPSLRRKV
jgi:hypothetical protein